MTDRRLEATRDIAAAPPRLFALLSTPSRHPELDASGAVHAARTPGPITAVGDVFVMAMHGRDLGDYLVDNHVVAFEPGREIAWAPATHGGERGGQVWTFRLEPVGDRTRVTHIYDWSGVTLERLLPYLPVTDAAGLAATLERVAGLVEDRAEGRAEDRGED